MLFDRVCGNLARQTLDSQSGGDLPDDQLDLSWNNCLRRAQSAVTKAGHTVRILLPLGVSLRHGDVISNGRTKLLTNVLPCEVLVIRPQDARQAMVLALALGNLHAPVECDGDNLVTLPDGPIEEVLTCLSAQFAHERRRFHPATIAAPIRAQLAADFQVWRQDPVMAR